MRAGIFQCDAAGLIARERIQLLGDMLSGQNLDLVVCPELFMSGYDAGEVITEVAETREGAFSVSISKLARSHNTAIVYGYPELADQGLYNAALCIGRDGAEIANHRKLLLPPGFERGLFKPGQALTLFELNGFRCAILVCYDVEFPEAVRAVAEAGAELVIVPTALGKEWDVVAHKVVPSRAFENGVWILYANHAGRENGTEYLGGSCIIAPTGRDCARAGTAPVLISAEFSRADVIAAQSRLPYIQEVSLLRDKLREHAAETGTGEFIGKENASNSAKNTD